MQTAGQCQNNCLASNNTINCQAPEDDFTEVFAPNCGNIRLHGWLSSSMSHAFRSILTSPCSRPKIAFPGVMVKQRVRLFLMILVKESSSRKRDATVEPVQIRAAKEIGRMKLLL
ncbi:OLC1v1000303C1 [Oldenlandia corymbosa var. corymbosa]|uniref:OLC1v1000303C1 n=1 Tax=Oldenlandia corymbosa var. corymbosa TaxID=529605 RepID=A0AAV1D2Z4_OLDCO|nr:OLC1v1000303C1 [Oldenlandia corymbosa var. corymbosa]